MRSCRLIVDVAALLVPAGQRDTWRREWHGEIAFRAQRVEREGGGSRGRAALLWRCRSALTHACWLRLESLRPEMIGHDVRYAARSLARRPGIAITSIVTLALGVGASSAMFAIVQRTILAPLPFPAADRLMAAYGTAAPPGPGLTPFSYPDFTDWRAAAETIEMAAVQAPADVTVAAPDGAERIRAAIVSADFFTLFGREATAGRLLLPSDELDGAEPAVVVSESFRSRHLTSAAAVGSLMPMNGKPRRIVGVIAGDPLGDVNGPPAEVWLPIVRTARPSLNRGNRFLSVFARLRSGSTPAQAEAELDAIAHRLAAAYPETNAGRGGRVRTLRESLLAPSRPGLLLLSGVVAILLLVACANLASLSAAAALARRGEFEVRLAVGATAARVVRQILVENAVLAAAGGAAALAMLYWTMTFVVSQMPASIPRTQAIAVDWRVAGVTVVIALASSLVFGGPVAWTVLRRARQDGAGGGSSRMSPRWQPRRALVAAQIALSVILLVPAALLVASYLRLQQVDPGFNGDRVVTMQLALRERYQTPAAERQFVSEAIASIAALPDIEAVALMGPIPLSGNRNRWQVQVDGGPPDPAAPLADRYLVTPGALRALRLRLVAGRFIDDGDRAGADRIAVVDERFAAQMFGTAGPIGRRIRLENNDWLRIVGVVGHVTHTGLGEAPRSQIYVSYDQDPVDWLNLVVRGRTAEPRAEIIRAAIQRIDPTVPAFEIASLALLRARSTAEPRLAAQLVFTLGALTLAVAGVGLYGAIAFSASRRVREMGIRMALGARPADVARLVAADGARLVGIGAGAGIPLAALAVKLIRSRLFHTAPFDAAACAAVVAGLALTALAASGTPVWRSARIDPTEALRSD